MKELKDYKLKDVKYYIEGRETDKYMQDAKKLAALAFVISLALLVLIGFISYHAEVIDEIVNPLALLSASAIVFAFILYVIKWK